MKTNQFLLYFLLTIFLCAFGCSISKPTPNPLEGWNFCFSQDPSKLDEMIQADYKDYIQKLPPEERNVATYDHDFEDGKGQHAIMITVGLNGINWRHMLIYDKNNKRINVIKYASGNSRS